MILLAIALSVGTFGFFVSKKNSNPVDGSAVAFLIGITLCVAGWLTVFVFPIHLLSMRIKASELEARHAEIKRLVEGETEPKTHLSFIYHEAIDMNTEIRGQRRYVDSTFIGCWYSRRVANLELIRIPVSKEAQP